MSSLEMPPNPAALAETLATEIALAKEPKSKKELEWDLMSLDHAAAKLGFIRSIYKVRAYRGIFLPGHITETVDTEQEDFTTELQQEASHFEADQVEHKDMYDIAFKAEFICYFKSLIALKAGQQALNAVCLTFYNVTLLPEQKEAGPDHLLIVPVHAVQDIAA